MTEYKVGCIGNLISARSDQIDGPTIVYKDVKSHPHQDQVAAQSSGERTSPKKKVTFDATISTSVNRKNKKRKYDETLPKNGREDAIEPQEDDVFSQNAKRRVHLKKNSHQHIEDPERESRTVFVGNVPYAHSAKKKLVKFFSNYGEVESVRIRCAPLKDPRTSKKVAVIKREFHPDRSSISAYVVFKTSQGAQGALKADGVIYHEHHLRIDSVGNASRKQTDPKRSVFIGNVPFAAEEEDLWKLFSECGTIESVRIVRDRITAVSKGIAYVNFQSSDAAELALNMDSTLFKKRNIKVSRLRFPAKSPSVISAAEKVVRHKALDEASRNKTTKKEEVRLFKKNKRKMRKEGENLLGISKKRKEANITTEQVDQEETKSKKKRAKLSKLAEETVEDTKKINQNKVTEELKQVKVKNGLKENSKLPKLEESQGTEMNEVMGGKNKSKHLRFQGRTVEESKKKKKKINKGELKKKKTAALLSGGSHQKKKRA